MNIHARSLADVLPVQDHYYALHDGVRYAKHGMEDANGLLVFGTRQQADQFCRSVGVGLPAFQPVRIPAEELLRLIEEYGALCRADGMRVMVATLKGRCGSDQSVNPESVVEEDSNWERMK